MFVKNVNCVFIHSLPVYPARYGQYVLYKRKKEKKPEVTFSQL